jgi:hypothetical protein
MQAMIDMFESRGIYIPIEHIDMVVGCMCHWLEHDRHGQDYMAYLQGLDVIHGRHEEVYKLRDGFGRLTKEIDPEKIVFLRGCLVEGEPVPASLIEISDREIEYCESCGSRTVCTATLRSSHTDNLETLCSHCISSSGDFTLKDQTSVSCEDCTYTDCNWHPVNADVPSYNPAI